jgi:ubiquinone/menaquinone biosynthesis C-methylase UbiE
MSNQHHDLNFVYYSDYYSFEGRSKWMEKIWSEAFGAQYPKGLEHYGYLTNWDLEQIKTEILVPAGSHMLDLGCGKSGPSLRLAEQLGLKLTGIDIVEDALVQAREFQHAFQLKEPAEFLHGHFLNIPLPDESVDVVISIDSLWAARDKIVALREAKRVMKRGARFIFTFWDLHHVESVPQLALSGLKFISRQDCPNWIDYQRKVYEGIQAHREELVAEMGQGANMLLYEAEASPPYLDQSVRRIYVWEKE